MLEHSEKTLQKTDSFDFLKAAQDKVNPFLSALIDTQPASTPLQEMLRYAVLGGGKRFRAALVFTLGDVLKVAQTQLTPLAAAVELVHAYSLVHDDLPSMDNASLRRGLPSCWHKFGEANAILLGDALQSLAYETLAASVSDKPEHLLKIIQLLSKAIGANGMVAGQLMDIQQTAQTPEEVSVLNGLKTGALITFCCEAPAILAAASKPHRVALRQYGKLLGFIFQMTDDVMDHQGTAAHLGKNTAQDQSKNTLFNIWGAEGHTHRISAYEKDAHQAIALFGEKAQPLNTLASWVRRRTS